jgi:hypothetical protein
LVQLKFRSFGLFFLKKFEKKFTLLDFEIMKDIRDEGANRSNYRKVQTRRVFFAWLAMHHALIPNLPARNYG